MHRAPDASLSLNLSLSQTFLDFPYLPDYNASASNLIVRGVFLPHAFLLEAGFWGLPYGTLARDLRDAPAAVLSVFTRERIQAGRARIWVSAHRVGILIDGIPESQADQMTEIRGPKASVAYDFNRLPTPAARGFASAQGVELKDLVIRDVDGEKFLFARRGEKGRPSLDIIPKLIPAILAALPWTGRPWNDDAAFPQPPAYICALADEKIVSCSIDGVTSGRDTGLLEGGVFRKISVPSAVEYPGIMSGLGLTQLPADRQKIMESHFQSIVESGATVRKEPRILERIAFEVERPQPVVINLGDDAWIELPDSVYMQILADSPAYLPTESSRGGLLPKLIGFVEKRNLASNEADVRARDIERRMMAAADAWSMDLAKPLDEWAAGLRQMPQSTGTGTMYDAALNVSRMAQQLSRLPGLAAEIQESQVDRVILLAMSEYCFAIVRKYPELAGTLIAVVAERKGIPPETVSIVRDTAGFWAGRDVIPTDHTAIVCSLAGMLARLRDMSPESNRETIADRLLNLLITNDICIDIVQACGAADVAAARSFWLEALTRKMQREGMDRRKFEWLIPDGGIDPVSILTAARSWKDGVPADAEQLKSLLGRLQQRLALAGTSELPLPPETPPEKALHAKLELLENPACLSYIDLFEHLAGARIHAEACLMDLPTALDLSQPDIGRRVALLRRYTCQLRRLPFLGGAQKQQASATAGGVA